MRRLPLSLSLILFALACVAPLDAAPRISEFLAQNVTGLRDEDGSEEDWIEIHNPGAGSVSLAGWSLTDDSTRQERWFFPNMTLAPGQRLIVFASGKNRTDPTSNLHTSFSLKASGEYLALLNPSATPISAYSPQYPGQLPDVSYGVASEGVALVNVESLLSYHLPSEDIGTSWREAGFTDPLELFVSSDASGPLHPGIGYDTGGGYNPLLGVVVADGTISAYARLPFVVGDPDDLTGLVLEMQYDDAFVAWINGVEVMHSAGASADPAWDSTSSVDHEASLNGVEVFDLTNHLGVLEAGTNVLAIQILNRSASSSDLLANPKLIGTGDASGVGYLTPPTPGASNGAEFVPGPTIVNVTSLPVLPGDGDPIVVSAMVVPQLGSVSMVVLRYRVMYGGEQSLLMNDLGGGMFSATIPASASSVGQMVRWRIEATDTFSRMSREPAYLDREGSNQSPEYLGTVIADPSVPASLPIYHWFTQDEAGSRNRNGARASFFSEGEFHDNIFVRQRGGFTNTSSQKFDFNQGDSFEYDPDVPKIGEVNMNGRGADSSYLRQPIAFDALRLAGCPSSITFPVQMRLNGFYDRVGFHIEQVDADFLKRQDLPKNGALYKFVQRSNLRPGLNDTNVGTEKKTRLQEDFSDLDAFIAGLKQSLAGTQLENSGSLIHTPAETAARDLFLFDNLNVPRVVDYLAGQIIVQDTDDTRKNFYLYRDTEGSGEWYLFPWDKDFTFGVGESAGGSAKHPFWGDAQHKNPNANQWNVLFDAVHNNPRLRGMILRRTRTLMEELYTTSAGNSAAYFEPEAARLKALIDPVLNISSSSLLAEFDERRQDLFVDLYGPSGTEPLIPESQTSALIMEFGALEFNPSSANQDQEFVELINANAEDLDISGWTLSEGITYTFPGGTVVLAGESIYVSPATGEFRSREVSPTGGEGLLVVGPYSGNLSSFGETVVLSNAAGTELASITYAGDPSDAQRYLVMSEFHYHPLNEPRAEFIELLNTSGSVTIDLSGVKFIAGVQFDFATAAVRSLAPGARVLIVRDEAAFVTIYGTGLASLIAGEFANETSLSNAGERVKIDDASNSTILDFTYSDLAPWPEAADGAGPSLVLIDPYTMPDHSDPAQWMAGEIDGDPGEGESGGGSAFDSWLAGRGQTDPLADPDGDGWTELETYVLAGDLRPRGAPFTVAREAGETILTLVVRDSGDVQIFLELSHDLDLWVGGSEGADFETILNASAGDGARDLQVRLLAPWSDAGQTYCRLRTSVTAP